jgi:acylglycerol lipase
MVHGTEDQVKRSHLYQSNTSECFIQVTSYRVSKAFYDAIPAEKKSFESFEVGCSSLSFESKLICCQGGYHELQNEPDGVQEKLLGVIVAFVQANLSAHTPLAPRRSNL